MLMINIKGQCVESKSLCEKIYLQSDRISFYESKIYVKLENEEVVLVPAIYSDQEGYYVLIAKGQRCPHWQWKCKVCGTCNTYNDYLCPVCNKGTQDD